MVKKKVSKSGNVMKIFDGEIELPKKMELRDIPSVKMLKEELKEVQKEKVELEKLVGSCAPHRQNPQRVRKSIQ
jgi:hypothetical protein